MWRDVNEEVPELNNDGESNWVLCEIYCPHQKNLQEYCVLYWDGKKWGNMSVKDYQDNQNHWYVKRWMHIPEYKEPYF